MRPRVPALIGAAVLALTFPASGQDRDELKRARAALRKGDYAAAERAYERLASARPDAWDVRAGLIRACLERGRFDAAVRTAEEFLRRVPDHAGARTALAQAAFERGDFARALESLGPAPSDVRARALAARALAELDRTEDAARMAEPLVEAYASRADDFMKEDLFAVAQGLHLYGRLAGSAEAARKAIGLILPDLLKADPGDAAARAFQGQCFLDAGDLAAAAREFETALETNPNFVPAILGLARAFAASGRRGNARTLCDRALEVHPTHAEAHALRAELLLYGGNRAEALAGAERGLESKPQSVRLLALRAALRDLAGDAGAEEDLKKASALHPGSGRAAGEAARVLLASGSRRYEDAHALLRKSVEVKQPAPERLAAWGLSCLRRGDVDAARKALEEAGRRDPLDRRSAAALATLNAFDRDYDLVERGPFRLLVARDERRFTEPVATALLSRAWEEMSGRYGRAPEAPIRVEIVLRAADLAVRTAGLPSEASANSGACFGRAVVVLSPRARDAADANLPAYRWAAVLWRQVARAFSLGLSGGRAPEWLTEGLAAVEESRCPGGLREKDWWTLTASGGVKDLEGGGAAREAAAVAFFLMERHSFEAAVRLLRGYADRKRTAELFRDVLGTSVEEFDTAFASWLKERREKMRYLPRAGARALLGADDRRAEEMARRGVEADPESKDARSALGQALVRRNQYDDALAQLRRGRDDYSTWNATGRALAELQRPKEAAEAFRRAVECFPSWIEDAVEEGAWGRLNEALLTLKDYEGALKAFEGMVAADPLDFRNRVKLAALHQERKDLNRMAAVLEEASWIETRDLALLDLQAALHRARREFAHATEKTLAALSVLEADPKTDEEGAGDRARADRYCAIGEDWLARGDKAKALEYAQDALRRVSGLERARALYEASRK